MITSTGIGSGLDVESLVNQLVAAEGRPQQLRLNRQEAKMQATLSAMGTLKSELASFKDAVSKLDSPSAFQAIKASVGNRDLLTASAAAKAATGTYSVEVQQLAQAQKLASKAFADSSAALGTGTLSFRFGSYDNNTNTFTGNPDRTAQIVTIDSAHNSLSGIRDAVNEADIGVQANIINDGTGDRLVFTAQTMGLANSLEITVSDEDGNNLDESGLSQLAYDPTGADSGSGKSLTETVAAQDARLVVDGLTVTRPQNTITGMIEGVTLELNSAELDSPTTLTVAADGHIASKSVNGFVEAFNSLAKTLNSLSSYNPETQEKGPLLGDASLRGIENRLRRVASDTVTGLSGPYRTLADIGITTQRDGTLKLDESKLQQVVESDPEAVARLFTGGGSSSDPLVRFVEATDEAQAGEFAVNVTQPATQGKYTGNVFSGSGSPITIDADNDEFTLKVDGGEAVMISLTQQTYNDGMALAQEIQSQINVNPTLSGAGSQVTIEFINDRFEIRSSRYGSGSNVEILALDPSPSETTTQTLGLTVKSGNAGEDVAGTIGAQAATGSGRFLTGSDRAEGIRLEILGESSGARGSISFSRGVAAHLNTYLDQVLDSEGFLENRIDGLNHRIGDFSEQREDLVQRLDAIEKRYRAQFTVLDSLLGQLQTTSSFLSQQIANLPGNRSA
ncbi:Flagellar hook-associated protein 2 [Nitrosococcus oceani ATCC 19707]|uniref:Flagellar hook-associated protein 2 n=1 Tax=Nitrosococcus oceani (strain ATCC 19707 / BCRC 17464 / JCM 30415 / NCIMB 11848 / C-107) TaxID=323261 RepID=Q3J8M3_NITOC|nr:flagellar filament capping protein FliD [Nitrosococcus oceani]ABA58823.1 Flagellar hook-associated protein 2 [Nitrosococcus oceani ATCC 19707]GEM19086.1 flagellar hook protein [Nitrosococcus oceani]